MFFLGMMEKKKSLLSDHDHPLMILLITAIYIFFLLIALLMSSFQSKSFIIILCHKATSNKQYMLRVTFARQVTGALEPGYEEAGRPHLFSTF